MFKLSPDVKDASKQEVTSWSLCADETPEGVATPVAADQTCGITTREVKWDHSQKFSQMSVIIDQSTDLLPPTLPVGEARVDVTEQQKYKSSLICPHRGYRSSVWLSVSAGSDEITAVKRGRPFCHQIDDTDWGTPQGLEPLIWKQMKAAQLVCSWIILTEPTSAAPVGHLAVTDPDVESVKGIFPPPPPKINK